LLWWEKAGTSPSGRAASAANSTITRAFIEPPVNEREGL
jgi:hypothetical protein